MASLAIAASSAHAATLVVGTEIGVDFGSIAPTNNFNQINRTSDGSLGAGTLINTSGDTVDNVGFSWSANNPWFSNDDSLSFTGQPAVFNDSNTEDWMGISESGGPTGIITLTFSGLSDSLTYDLVIGARYDVNSNADTSWTVDGQTLLATATSDTEAYRSFTGLSTDGAGNLVITGTGAGSRTDIATVSALHLTAVPEPSALALLGVGGMLILLRRRR